MNDEPDQVPLESDRRAARVILLDSDDRVLLFCMFDPAAPELGERWITPGGGLDDDESFADAACRELCEETGIVVESAGLSIHEEVTLATWGSREIRQHQQFFVVRCERTELDFRGWDPSERATTRSHRWWTLDELRNTAEVVLPPHLAELVVRALERLD